MDVTTLPLVNADERALVDVEAVTRLGLDRLRWSLDPNGYVTRGQGRHLHRLIAPPPPGHVVVFRNGNRLDCRRANLEHITCQELARRGWQTRRARRLLS